MGQTVNIHEAKTHLSRLLQRVERGATVTIARAGEPIAQLVPLGRSPAPRRVREPAQASQAVVQDRAARLQRFLELEVWPEIPAGEAGRRLGREEEDELLGYGSSGA